MTKAIRSYPKSERIGVAQRRVRQNTGGMGYYSAKSYLERGGEKVEEVKEIKEAEVE